MGLLDGKVAIVTGGGRGLELHAEASRVTAASPLAVRWCEEKINDKTNYRNGRG